MRDFFLADGGAGHRKRTDDRKQVAGRVHPHQPVAPLPVDRQPHSLARTRKGLIVGRHVDDVVLAVAGHRGCDGDGRQPIRADQPPDVARLAAGGRVKDRPVEQDATLMQREHRRFRLREIGVVAKKGLRPRHQATSSKGMSISGSRSIQSGTGSCLERRKAGLKSFDW